MDTIPNKLQDFLPTLDIDYARIVYIPPNIVFDSISMERNVDVLIGENRMIYESAEIKAKSKKIDYDNEAFPCLFCECKYSKRIIIYFHSFTDNLATVAKDLKDLSKKLQCHIIAPEYEGFGLCFYESVSQIQLNKRSLRLFNYLTQVCSFDRESIIIMGNREGCDTALELACISEPHMVCLINMHLKKLDSFSEVVSSFKVTDEFDFKRMENKAFKILIMHSFNNQTVTLQSSKLFEEFTLAMGVE
mmetsp:Transcript_170/g.162  ORF Transcript_170/g.162 Transcript_170/m.162 type:complete len:247 (+) Transcript_170:2-742(+)